MIPASPQLPAGTPGTKSPDGFAALTGNPLGSAGTEAFAAFSTLLDAAAASSAPASDAPATTDAKAAVPAGTAPLNGKLEAAPGKILPPGTPAFDKRDASARNIAASSASQDVVIGEADALTFKAGLASNPAAGPGAASDSPPALDKSLASPDPAPEEAEAAPVGVPIAPMVLPALPVPPLPAPVAESTRDALDAGRAAVPVLPASAAQSAMAHSSSAPSSRDPGQVLRAVENAARLARLVSPASPARMEPELGDLPETPASAPAAKTASPSDARGLAEPGAAPLSMPATARPTLKGAVPVMLGTVTLVAVNDDVPSAPPGLTATRLAGTGPARLARSEDETGETFAAARTMAPPRDPAAAPDRAPPLSRAWQSIVRGAALEQESDIRVTRPNAASVPQPGSDGAPGTIAVTDVPSSISNIALASDTALLRTGGDPQAVRGPSAGEAVQAPHDFARLVARLDEAREGGGTLGVHTSLVHAQFGHVSLRLRPEEGGMSVTLASADPEFAGAVIAAAQTGASIPAASSLQHEPAREGALSGQHQQGAGQSQSGSEQGPQQRENGANGGDRANTRQRSQGREGNSPAPQAAPAAHDASTQNGIYA